MLPQSSGFVATHLKKPQEFYEINSKPITHVTLGAH